MVTTQSLLALPCQPSLLVYLHFQLQEHFLPGSPHWPPWARAQVGDFHYSFCPSFHLPRLNLYPAAVSLQELLLPSIPWGLLLVWTQAPQHVPDGFLSLSSQPVSIPFLYPQTSRRHSLLGCPPASMLAWDTEWATANKQHITHQERYLHQEIPQAP